MGSPESSKLSLRCCVLRSSLTKRESLEKSHLHVEGHRLSSSTYDNNGSLLHLVKKTDNPECFVKISSSNPGSIHVNGISILSESRTLEITNNSDGYIATVRGEKVQDDNDGVENQQSQIYRCSYIFSKSQTDFQVKFLSLGNKDELLIQSLTLNIQQQMDGNSRKSLSTFDMNKLKSDIEEMGDSVSERALDFLKTMELYEKNKSLTLGNWIEHNDHDSSHTSSPQNSQPIPNQTMVSSDMLSNGLSSIMESVLGQDAISSLSKNKTKNGDQGNSPIYSMLQAVCGEVSKRRKPLPTSNDVSEETNTQLLNSSSEERVSNEQSLVPVNTDFLMQVEKRLEEAKGELRMEIKSAKEQVLFELNKMNQEMEKKMDLILQLLQNSLPQTSLSDSVADMER